MVNVNQGQKYQDCNPKGDANDENEDWVQSEEVVKASPERFEHFETQSLGLSRFSDRSRLYITLVRIVKHTQIRFRGDQ